jgi:hypothetical protein
MRTDGQTVTTKLIVAFRNFANAPKNVLPNLCYRNSSGRLVLDRASITGCPVIGARTEGGPLREVMLTPRAL